MKRPITPGTWWLEVIQGRQLYLKQSKESHQSMT